MNSVFVVKVKITFSHVFANKLNIWESFSFFQHQAKYTAIYTTIKLKTNYVLE